MLPPLSDESSTLPSSSKRARNSPHGHGRRLGMNEIPTLGSIVQNG